MAEREPGPYWVRCEGTNWEEHARDKWIIALWDGHFWGVPFDYQSYRDPQFAEIGERIERSGNLLRSWRYFTREKLEEALNYDWGQVGEAATLAMQIMAHDLSEPAKQLPDFVWPPAQWPEPQPITDAQKTGERFLVWVNSPEYLRGWAIGSWEDGQWVIYLMGTTFMTTVRPHLVTHCYPLPPDVTG